MEGHIETVSKELDESFGKRGVERHVMIGHPTNTILHWADNNEVDCIVVTSHRPGFTDLLLGSTASRLVRHATCPVMVLR